MNTINRKHTKITAIMISILLIFQITALGMQSVYAAEEDTEVEATEENVKETEKEETPSPEPKKEEPAEEKESTEEQLPEENTEEAPEEEPEEEEDDAASITVEYAMNVPADASFVPEIKGIDGNSEIVRSKKQQAYGIRGLSRNLYQTQKNSTSAKISYEFMGWKSESGQVVAAGESVDLTAGKKFDKNGDGIVKLTATWNNTFGFNKDGKYRYTTFSIYKTGQVPTGLDNNAGNYVGGIYGTVAYPGDATEPLMKNWKQNDTGRVVVNQDSNGIGIDECDQMIRDMTETPVSTYFDSRNGNEAAGYNEYEISLMDMPSDEEVLKELEERIRGGLKLQVVFEDGARTLTIDDLDTFDTAHYEVKWFSVKYQNNGIHVDGIVVPRTAPVEEPAEEEPAEEEPVEEPEEEEPQEEEPAEGKPAEEEPEEEEPVEEEPEEEEPAEEEPVDEEPEEEPQEEPAAEEPAEEKPAEEEPENGTLQPTEAPAEPEVEEEPEMEEEPEEEPEAPAEPEAEGENIDEIDTEEEPVQVFAGITKAGEMVSAMINDVMNGEAGEAEGFAPMSSGTAAGSNEAAETETIENESAPLAGGNAGEAVKTWALFNLILAAVAAVAGLITAANRKNNKLVRAMSLIPAAIAFLVFALTEDTTLEMASFDGWTSLITGIFVIQIAAALTAGWVKKEEPEK